VIPHSDESAERGDDSGGLAPGDLCMHGNWVRFPSMLANTVARRNRLNSQPPIGVGRVVLHSRQRGDILVAWREMADRVGRASVTGERERLAAAAAEIDLALPTACARLLHPGGSAEGIEGRNSPR
jgi:hypothetical protein